MSASKINPFELASDVLCLSHIFKKRVIERTVFDLSGYAIELNNGRHVPTSIAPGNMRAKVAAIATHFEITSSSPSGDIIAHVEEAARNLEHAQKDINRYDSSDYRSISRDIGSELRDIRRAISKLETFSLAM